MDEVEQVRGGEVLRVDGRIGGHEYRGRISEPVRAARAESEPLGVSYPPAFVEHGWSQRDRSASRGGVAVRISQPGGGRGQNAMSAQLSCLLQADPGVMARLSARPVVHPAPKLHPTPRPP